MRADRLLRAAGRGVDHRVADQLDAVAGDPLGGQVLDCVLRGAEQKVRDPVGDHAVHLLGHAPVA
jgi:hypothetical protein